MESAPPLTPDDFQQETGVSRETRERFEAYAALLKKWNQRINLVSQSSLADLWRRHFLDSAQLYPLLPPEPRERPRVLVDLGSGAGFPGLVLAILGAGDVHLVEADARKVAFLREAARVTATDVKLHNCRIENQEPFPADVVTARALAPLSHLIELAEPFLRPDSRCLFLKGETVGGELETAHRIWNFSVVSHPSCTYPSGRILVVGVNGRATTRY